jgi:EamA domain-containing membrane protein RarD
MQTTILLKAVLATAATLAVCAAIVGVLWSSITERTFAGVGGAMMIVFALTYVWYQFFLVLGRRNG